MDKLRNMEVFVATVDHGGFTAAAAQLDISSVMVGKHIRQLEEYLGTRLLQRTTRKQSLTDAGQEYYRNCKQVLEQVRWAESSIESLQAVPRGMLRISAPVTYGSSVLAPALAAYVEAFPEVRVELVLTNNRIDLMEEGYDLAIRVGPVGDDRLVARALASYRMMICGAPAYIERYGMPTAPEDLHRHHCLGHLVWTSSQGSWPASDQTDQIRWPEQGRFASNDGRALLHAAIHGAGLIFQPEALVGADIAAGRLVPVLESFWPQARPVHLLYLQDARPRPKLASILDYLIPRLL